MRSDGPRFDFAKNEWVGDSPYPVASSDEPPAPGKWSKPPPKDVPNPLRYGLPAFFFLFVVGCAFAGLWVVAVMGLLAAVFAIREIPKTVPYRESRTLDEADRRLLEDPDDKNVCLVLITIFRDEKPVGTDKGVVWFAEGKLFYSGHRTSFVVGGQDVLPREGWRVFVTSENGFWWYSTSLPLIVAEGNAYVRFEPLSYGDAQQMRFSKRFRRFREEPPPSVGPRQLPPLDGYLPERSM